MSDDVVKADPRLRFWVTAGLALLSLIGVGAHLWLVPQFEAYWRSLPTRDALRSMQWCLTVVFLPCAAMGYYLLRLAQRIRATDQFPPPGMAVIKATVVVRGGKAERVGKSFLFLGGLLFIVAFIGGYVVPWMMLHRLFE